MRILLQSQVSSNSNTSINILYSIQYFISFRHCNKICDKLSNKDKTIELFIRLSRLIIISMLSHSNRITIIYMLTNRLQNFKYVTLSCIWQNLPTFPVFNVFLIFLLHLAFYDFDLIWGTKL